MSVNLKSRILFGVVPFLVHALTGTDSIGGGGQGGRSDGGASVAVCIMPDGQTKVFLADTFYLFYHAAFTPEWIKELKETISDSELDDLLSKKFYSYNPVYWREILNALTNKLNFVKFVPTEKRLHLEPVDDHFDLSEVSNCKKRTIGIQRYGTVEYDPVLDSGLTRIERRLFRIHEAVLYLHGVPQNETTVRNHVASFAQGPDRSRNYMSFPIWGNPSASVEVKFINHNGKKNSAHAELQVLEPRHPESALHYGTLTVFHKRQRFYDTEVTFQVPPVSGDSIIAFYWVLNDRQEDVNVTMILFVNQVEIARMDYKNKGQVYRDAVFMPVIQLPK